MRIQDRYETSTLLGEGAFGCTLAGRNVSTGAEVVLKQISVRGLPGWKPLEYFEREVAVLRTLDHPGVPRFVEAFETETERGPTLVLVMERIEGETLLARIQRGHRWQDQEARDVLDTLLATLDYLHGLSPPVIHRDIKPGNIMLRHGGSPVLVDFGAVHASGMRAGHGSLSVIGTIGYIAPEQAMGAPVPASDLYGLGATLVHALSHCHPADLPRRDLQMTFEDRVGCSPELVAVLRRLVQPDLRKRYARASEARADLRRPLAALPPAPVSLLPLDRATLPAPVHLGPRPLTVRTRVLLRRKAIFRMIKRLGGWGATTIIGAGILTAIGRPDLELVVLAMLSLLGAAGTLAVDPGAQRDMDLYRTGVEAEARVYAIRLGIVSNPFYGSVLYSFAVGSENYLGKAGFPPAAARQVKIYDSIRVFYDPADPDQHLACLAE